jgi:hypothetical protein
MTLCVMLARSLFHKPNLCVLDIFALRIFFLLVKVSSPTIEGFYPYYQARWHMMLCRATGQHAPVFCANAGGRPAGSSGRV